MQNVMEKYITLTPEEAGKLLSLLDRFAVTDESAKELLTKLEACAKCPTK